MDIYLVKIFLECLVKNKNIFLECSPFFMSFCCLCSSKVTLNQKTLFLGTVSRCNNASLIKLRVMCIDNTQSFFLRTLWWKYNFIFFLHLEWSGHYGLMTDLTDISLLKWKWKLLSLVKLFVTWWTVAHQAALTMEFSRQEYWSGLPCPSPGHLPDPGIEPGSPALQAGSLQSEPPGLLCPSLFQRYLRIFCKVLCCWEDPSYSFLSHLYHYFNYIPLRDGLMWFSLFITIGLINTPLGRKELWNNQSNFQEV